MGQFGFVKKSVKGVGESVNSFFNNVKKSAILLRDGFPYSLHLFHVKLRFSSSISLLCYNCWKKLKPIDVLSFLALFVAVIGSVSNSKTALMRSGHSSIKIH